MAIIDQPYFYVNFNDYINYYLIITDYFVKLLYLS